MHTSYSKDKIINKLNEREYNSYMEKIKNLKTNETYGLPFCLYLKINAKYMLTININTNDGLTNGAIGTLRDIIFEYSDTENLIPKTLLIEYENILIGKDTRSSIKQSKLTPIHLCTRTFQYKRKQDLKICRTQFPCIPAEAITIHKSQGKKTSEFIKRNIKNKIFILKEVHIKILQFTLMRRESLQEHLCTLHVAELPI